MAIGLWLIASSIVLGVALIAYAVWHITRTVERMSPEEQAATAHIARRVALCLIERHEQKSGQDLRCAKEVLR